MKKRILISIDSHKREYIAVKLLRNALEAKGFEVEMCSRYVLRYAYNRFKPDVVFVHSSHKVPELDTISKHAVIVLLQAESCAGNRDAILSITLPGIFEARFDLVDIRYCWGKFDYDLLSKHTEAFPNAELILTGHPITELWHRKRKPIKIEKPVRIGITTSLRALTHIAGGYKNPVQLINSVERAGASGYFDPPNHAESWIAFEAAWIRIIGQLIQELKEYKIYLRPHPLEEIRHYKFFEQLMNVQVSNHEHIIEWLDHVDVLLSFLSGSQLDAFVAGKNVISLRNFFPDFIKERLPKMLDIEHDHYLYAPSSMQELKEVLLDHKYDQGKLENFTKNVFNFPSKMRPSELIVQHLTEYLSKPLNKEKFFPLPEKPLERMIPSYFHKDDLHLLYRDLKGKLTGKENVSLSYCRHRILRNYQYDKFLQNILAD